MTFLKFNSRFSKKASLFSAMTGLSLLAGCYTPVEDLKPTTFGQDQLNVASTGRIVTILSVMPAQATVVNTNRNADGLVGIFESPQLHPQSLILAYQDPNEPQIQNTIEIAKACEFKTGSAYAVLIDGQTKIQPNNFPACQAIAEREKSGKHRKGKKQPAQSADNAQTSDTAPSNQQPAANNTPKFGAGSKGTSWKQENAVQQAIEQQGKQNWPRPKTWSN